MRDLDGEDVAAQMAELLELAGSVEALLDAVDAVALYPGHRPPLVDVVNELMARRGLGAVAAPEVLAFA